MKTGKRLMPGLETGSKKKSLLRTGTFETKSRCNTGNTLQLYKNIINQFQIT